MLYIFIDCGFEWVWDAAQKDAVSSAGSVSNDHLKSQALGAQRRHRSSTEDLLYKIVMCSVGES